jgi:hypothetical protein
MIDSFKLWTVYLYQPFINPHIQYSIINKLIVLLHVFLIHVEWMNSGRIWEFTCREYAVRTIYANIAQLETLLRFIVA